MGSSQQRITFDNPSGERLDIAGSLLDSRSASYDLDDRKLTSVDAGGNITAYPMIPMFEAAVVTEVLRTVGILNQPTPPA